MTCSARIEMKILFLTKYFKKVQFYSIPFELIINADQTHSKLGTTENIKMATKDENYIFCNRDTDIT